MARKLKTYRTSLGFFDLAIAAPSMKAALEAWGSKANLFHQGIAGETADPAIVSATTARPGVVLRRAVGSTDAFTEHAELPRTFYGLRKPARRAPKSKAVAPQIEDKPARAALPALEKEQKCQDDERRRHQNAEEARRKRSERALGSAEIALAEARRRHDTTTKAIAIERSVLERRSESEDARWDRQRTKLQATLRRARER